MITKEQIEAAKAYYAACNHSDWDAVVAGMLAAAEKLGPIAAQRAFEVTKAVEDVALCAEYALEPQNLHVVPGHNRYSTRKALEAVSAELGKAQSSASEQAGEWTTADYGQAEFACLKAIEAAESLYPDAQTMARVALDAVSYRLQPQPAASEPERTSPDSTLEALEQTIIDGACDGVVSDEFSAALAELVRRAKASASEPERAKAFELSADEKEAYARAVAYAECDRWRVSMDDAAHLTYALDRALRTLGVTERERELERERNCHKAQAELAFERAQELERELQAARECFRIQNDACRRANDRAEKAEADLAAAKEREEELADDIDGERLASRRYASLCRAEQARAEKAEAELGAAKQECARLYAAATEAKECETRAVTELQSVYFELAAAKERSEPAGDKLTAEDREAVEHLRLCSYADGAYHGHGAVVSVLEAIDRLFPKPAEPAPKLAVEALAERWERLGAWERKAAEELREAIKADQERGR